MAYEKIYLENDAPGVFPPSNRQANWGNETVMAPQTVNAPLLDTEAAQFFDTFVAPSIQTTTGRMPQPNDLKGVFLRFHIHKDILLRLLAQGSDCYGIAINLGVKEYLYLTNGHESPPNSPQTETVPGIGITITPVAKDMQDLIEVQGKRDTILFCEEPTPCPPANPCPAQTVVTAIMTTANFNNTINFAHK